MVVRFLVGDLLTGRRIRYVGASAGSWSEVLNDSGVVSCTIPLSDPVNAGVVAVPDVWGPGDTVSTNLAPKPYPISAGGWSGASGLYPAALDTSFVRRPGTTSSVITRSATSPNTQIAVWFGVGAHALAVADYADVVQNTAYVISTYFTASIVNPRYRHELRWYDAGGSQIGGDVTQGLQATTAAALEWQRGSFSATSPAGAVKLRVHLYVHTAAGNVVGGEQAWAQDAMVSLTLEDYIDGAMADDTGDGGFQYDFTGTDFQSSSIKRERIVTVPAHTERSGESLANAAAVGKAFLAAVDGDLILQAGPIWVHDWDDDTQTLKLTASGMWSYFDHRVLLPVLAGRLPTDVTTDTRFSNIVSDPDAVGYPWVSDTRESLQTIAKRLVEQAQTWTNGDVPVILPDEVSGENERWYKGSAVAFVGQRLRELTSVLGGPDIMFTPRWTTDRLGIEWVMRVGTPSEPLLYSPQRQKFQLGIAGSSLSNLTVKVDGSRLASTGFATGGKSDGQAIVAVSEDSTLLDVGYPALDAVDSSHSTASEEATVQGYSDELVLFGRSPSEVWSFSHDLSERPFLEAFNAGDFATVSVRNNAYLGDGESTMRLLSRSGDIEGRKVALQFAPEVSDG